MAGDAGGDAAGRYAAAIDLLAEAHERGIRALRRRRLRLEVSRHVQHVLLGQHVGERLHRDVGALAVLEGAQLAHDVGRMLAREHRPVGRHAVAVDAVARRAGRRFGAPRFDGALLSVGGDGGQRAAEQEAEPKRNRAVCFVAIERRKVMKNRPRLYTKGLCLSSDQASPCRPPFSSRVLRARRIFPQILGAKSRSSAARTPANRRPSTSSQAHASSHASARRPAARSF